MTHTVSGYGTVTTADSVTVSVTDNEPAVEVSFGASTYTVAEGGTVTVAVTLDVDPERTVVIPITVTNQGGATNVDYSRVPPDVTFNSGDTSQTVTITATDDSVDDGGESIKLGFGTLPAKVTEGSTDETTVSITDNDVAGVGETTGQNRVCTKGEITVRGQMDRWVWRITDSSYWDEYTIDLMGLHSNKGTLRDPHIVYAAKIYTHDWFYPPGPAYAGFPSYASNDGGVGWDSSSRISFRIRTGSSSFFPGKEAELDTGYYTALVGANPFGDGANGLGSYTLCIEGPGSISAVDQPGRRIVVSAAHVDMSDGEPAQFSINLGARPAGPVEVFMTKLEPASDSQYVVEPLLHSFTVDNWDIPQVATVRRKSDYAPPLDDGFSIHYWGKGGGYHKEFEFLAVYDRVPLWMTLRSTYDPEPALTDQVSEAQKQNSPATGGPGIQGVARASETLIATTSQIRDEDGLDNAVFAYQWVLSELGAESGTDIAGATGSSYGVTAEDEGKAITVRVTFTDDAGNEESVISFAVVAATALPQTRAPDAPGAPDVSPHDSTSLAVSWTAPASDGGSTITGYKVRWKEAADSWDTPADVSEAAATGTSHTITGLTDGTEYSVRVLAINDIGEGLPSGDGSGTPRETVPPELSAASVDGATLTLSFNEAIDEDSEPAATAFTVTVSGNVRAVDSVDVSGGVVTLTLASAVMSQDTVTVSYTVPVGESAARLRDAGGNAAVSFTNESVTNDTAPAAPPQSRAPDAPDAPDVSPHDSTSLAVSWTAPASDGGSTITGYKVQWKEAADSWDTSADVSEAAATGTSHTITGLTDGTEYSVRVLAINDIGEGLPSGDGNGTPRETVPPELSAASVDGATLTLSFNEALNEDSEPAATAFTVTVSGNVRAVDSVDVSGGVVTLTLASAVMSQDTVTVSYTVPVGESAARLRDAGGNAAVSFTNESVTNDTAPAAPLTASVHDAPESHNGTDAFTFELRFSETPRRGFSYKTLRDHAFTVTGAELIRARRLEPGKNVRWEITVRPDSNDAVTIVLPATTDCAADGAICTGDGRMLSERVELVVSGPGG